MKEKGQNVPDCYTMNTSINEGTVKKNYSAGEATRPSTQYKTTTACTVPTKCTVLLCYLQTWDTSRWLVGCHATVFLSNDQILQVHFALQELDTLTLYKGFAV